MILAATMKIIYAKEIFIQEISKLLMKMDLLVVQ